ncbi:MAG: hypothetical protein M1831_004925 [Alyxoria varia]|nr:MAG: hypothetical protein M1831_004925 [Alyxoria varia]
MSRLALSTADKQVRDWFASTTASLGCTLTTDSMGNQFAVRRGDNRSKHPSAAPTVAGSHLDTQPTGGRYDGILGVCAGIEMLRCLEDEEVQTEGPIGVVNWTNEEGARFPVSMVASAVWAGSVPLATAHGLEAVLPLPEEGVDAGRGTTMLSELRRIEYLGDVECGWEHVPLAAHFELHIEQGPTLQESGKRIGVVKGVQAYRWFTICVRGRDAHTGTSDALLSAAHMITRARQVAQAHGTLASVGIINAKPGSTNTVPGLVTFSLDIRASTHEKVLETEGVLRKEFEAIARGEAGGDVVAAVEWRMDSDTPETRFHDDCVGCVERAAQGVEAGWQHITSGAGHDSVYTNKRCPTGMVFVPCKDGVSHNPEEYCSPGDGAAGAEVLANAVMGFDRLRGERGGW